MKISLKSIIVIGLMWSGLPLFAQQPVKLNASEIQLGLKKLNRAGSVLYVAAHPDDENTRLIAYMANHALLNTAYLSITRGDGGQNLVGPEIREMLGVIRTQELLQARKLDGGKQFFTRANDFGYSKTPQETFTIWDREAVLSDVVWAIRKFRPDVIITRFPTTGEGGHGQHTASAILAEEAFDAAADPRQFPEQLDHVDTWQAHTLMLNTHPWFYQRRGLEFDPSDKLILDVGAYNQLLGKSYTEIAAESRSMHKSQGFGSSGSRGSELEYLQHIKGEPITADYFQGDHFSWSRVKNGARVGALMEQAYRQFDPEAPDAIAPLLLEALSELKKLRGNYYADLKASEIKDLLKASLGLYLEASVAETSGTPGETLTVRLEATNRSNIPTTIKSFEVPGVEGDNQGATLGFNEKFTQELDLEIPADKEYSQPYWLKQTGSMGMFAVGDPLLIGKPQNDAALTIPFEINIAGTDLQFPVPVVHKRTDPVKGEIFQPFAIAPEVTVNFDEKVHVFADENPRKVVMTLKSGRDQVAGQLTVEVPDGWSISPQLVNFDIEQKGQEQVLEFTLYPPVRPGEGKIKAIATVGEQQYSLEKVTISYDHIPDQMLLPEAAAKVVKLDILTRGHRIGYLMGAGDDIPGSLRQIGYQVDILTPDQINVTALQQYDAVILGIRALNTVKRLQYDMEKLLAYAQQGGTLVVQYNTNFRMVTKEFAPYPLEISRDRVAVEGAPVSFLLPDHPVLNTPNKIGPEDFDAWVQERGLYFPNKWDDNYQAILSTNDPGESPKEGSLLIARYGEGYYVYTGLSWFRELPAGVPGAYRLFTNIISLGQEEPGD
ncbi:MAG: PIG-L family deacetylase [Cyclobacteriaceae bacterium]|nr:PIG-L family deacetylase [Cyclobacteriaceae bacterium]